MADRLSAIVLARDRGLASATALAQSGWRTTVLERAPGFGQVGAGWFYRQRMAALRLGVAEEVARRALAPHAAIRT